MQTSLIVPVLVTVIGVIAVGFGVWVGRRDLTRARRASQRLLDEARRDGDNLKREILVTAQEKALQLEVDHERREREFEDREGSVDARAREVETLASKVGHARKDLERRNADVERLLREAKEAEATTRAGVTEVRARLEQVAGLTTEQARAELITRIEAEAHKEASRIARKIEEAARQDAEREARNLILQASQRVNIRDVMESTVSFIELPNDEMKGRIIGKEGRNIRALEMATGIDLIVDDTPRSIWISSFDPVRREVARVSIDRLLVDGRIHPARIEEVVQQVSGEIDGLFEEKGREAAYSVGISDLHPQLARLVGKMRYHTSRGQNLLQHALEVATIGMPRL